jgi:peptidoglycan/xylan/chitin deacetylase (PgdA/CDA1 family)
MASVKGGHPFFSAPPNILPFSGTAIITPIMIYSTKIRNTGIFLALSMFILLSSISFAADMTARPDITGKDDGSVKSIYLTFDDGPLQGSADISEAIAHEKIKINVFVVGSQVKNSSKMKEYFKLYTQNQYIEIGNHSYSHAHDSYALFYSKPELAYLDFLYNAEMLNLKKKIARLPGRNMWRLKNKSIDDVKSGAKTADMLFRNGYYIFGWDLEWRHDPKSGAPVQTVDDMIYLIDTRLAQNKTVTENHLVILCHDEMFRKSWEESKLRELIERLKSRSNFRFEYLSNYPQ